MANTMTYEKPSFVEIKMDAEIGSYQADYDPSEYPQFGSPASASPEGGAADPDAPRG